LFQVLDLGAQVVVRGAATSSQQEKNNYADVQRRIVFFRVQRLIIRMRVITVHPGISKSIFFVSSI
jgi:hypothetical protein